MSFTILGTGMYVPQRVVTNDDLSLLVDTNDEWIRKRVGIERRHVSVSETTSEMGCIAARRALDNAGVRPEELDLILAATVSGEYVSPSVSCMIQHELGVQCPAYDINAACPAFIFLLETAAGFFARKKAKKVLVVGAERLSGIVDWTDRGTCVIFGDGAGAAVLGEGDGYLDSILTVSGGDDVIKIPHYEGDSPFYQRRGEKPYIHMEGQDTFKFAVNAICADVRRLLCEHQLKAEDVAYIVPHQANMRIIDFAARKLNIPLEKFKMDIGEYGNTSSASIPIALDELNRAGALHRGDLLILTGFGGGLASASCLVRW